MSILKEIEQKFSNLTLEQKLWISDKPFLINNFVNIKEFLFYDEILYDAINSDFVYWDLYDDNGTKLQIPYKKPYWYGPNKQQHKQFIIERVNNGHTFVIFRCAVLNEKLKQLTSIIQKYFYTNADIHVYGTKKQGKSFVPHADLSPVFILQLEGETDWIVFDGKISELLHMSDVLQNKVKLQEIKDVESNLEYIKEKKGLDFIINTTMKSGDLLYIPSRYYHCALPKSPRVSLSIPCVNLEIQNETKRVSIDGTQIDTNIYKF